MLDTWGGATASEVGGEAVVTLADGSATDSYGAFRTARYYDLRNDTISVEVTSVPNAATTAYAFLTIVYDDDNYIQFFVQKGKLYFAEQLAGVYSELKSSTYNATAHRFWRFREDGTDTYWETSSDGVTWVVGLQVPTSALFAMDSVRVQIGGATNGGEVSPGTARFDRINGGGAAAGKWCPVSSIKDAFDDGVTSTAWKRSWTNAPMTVTETGGQLVLTLAANDTQYSGYGSSSSFDLTNSAIVIAAPTVPSSATSAQSFLSLDGPSGSEIGFVKEKGNLLFRLHASGSTQDLGSVQYSATQHAWWRLRESGGTIYWETAPDGKTWTVQEQLSPLPFAIDALDVTIGAGTWQSQPSPGEAHFDNLNLPPP